MLNFEPIDGDTELGDGRQVEDLQHERYRVGQRLEERGKNGKRRTLAFFCNFRSCSTSLILTSLESTKRTEYCLAVSLLHPRSKSSEPSTGSTPKFKSLNARERTGKSGNGGKEKWTSVVVGRAAKFEQEDSLLFDGVLEHPG
jgi:hypothetical protein